VWDVVIVEGVVVSYAEKVSNRRVKLIVKDKKIGRILVYFEKYPEYFPGDEMFFEGVLEEAPEFEDFSYKRHLQTEGIFFVIRDPREIKLIKSEGFSLFDRISDFKTARLNDIKERFSYPASAIISGMVFGVRADFTEEFEAVLTRTGTMHIVAISGFNISILFSGLLLVGNYIERKIFNFICVFLLLFFLLFIGVYNYSAFRAVIFATLSLVGRMVGRKIPVSNVVSISVLLILILNPMAYRSVSFLFSLSAVLAVFYISSIFKFGSVLSSALAVFSLTGILQIYMFKNFSFIGILVNLFIAPLVSISTIGSVLYVFFSSFNYAAGSIVAIPLSLMVEFLLASIRVFGNVEFLFLDSIEVDKVWLIMGIFILVCLSLNNFYFKVMDKLSRRQ
jgi:competence protein ComEC